MDKVTLFSGPEKEYHLGNLVRSIDALAEGSAADAGLDQGVYATLRGQMGRVSALVDFLRYKTDEQDYHHNNGVYQEVKIASTGLPTYESCIHVLNDKLHAQERLASIASIESIEEEFRRVLMVKAGLDHAEVGNQVEQIANVYRRRKFYESLMTADIPSTTLQEQELVLNPLGGDVYNVSYTVHELREDAWLSCCIRLRTLTTPREPTILQKATARLGRANPHIEDRKSINMIDGAAHISEELFALMQEKSVYGCNHLNFWLNEMPSVHAEAVHVLTIGQFYSCHFTPTMAGKPNFLDQLFGQAQEGFALIAQKDLESDTLTTSKTKNRPISPRLISLPDQFLVVSSSLKKILDQDAPLDHYRIYEVPDE